MELISKTLTKFKLKTKKTNKFFLLASDIAKKTQTKPLRWIRDCKKHWNAANKALDDFKETKNIKNPPALFVFLLKKHKNADNSPNSYS